MGILDFLTKLFVSASEHCVYIRIPNEKVKETPVLVSQTIEAEKYYFRVWLAEMFLKDDRKLFKTFIPVVHSVTKLQFGNRATQELPYVAGPVNLNLDATLGKGVQINHALTNLLPFRGGSISIAAALVAYENKDFFESFMSTLNSLSGLLNIGQLSTTLKIIDSTVNGIQNMITGGNKDIHLVYSETFAGKVSDGGNPLTNGYIAIVNTSEGKIDKERLFVINSRLCYGDSIVTAKPIDGYDYILLRIELSKSRDDPLAFEEFAKLLNTAIEKGIESKSDGDAIMKTLKVVIWKSEDLTNFDKGIVYKACKDNYDIAIGDTLTTVTQKSIGQPDSIAKSIVASVKKLNSDMRFLEKMDKNVIEYNKKKDYNEIFKFD